MRKYGFLILNLVSLTLFVNAADIIQGPYRISNYTASVKIEKKDDINCPLSMVVYDKSSHYELDKICENGDYPNLRSVFFFTLKGVNHIGTIAAFFKIVVAQSCFKQPLFAPARVSRAAPDLASRHR